MDLPNPDVQPAEPEAVLEPDFTFDFGEHKGWVKDNDLAEIISANMQVEPLLKLFKEKGVAAALELQNIEYEKFLEHMELFKANEFSWEKLDSNLGPLRELTQFDQFTASVINPET